MIRKIITTALVSSALATGFAANAFAEGDGGGNGAPFAAMYNPDGSSASVHRNRDGSHTVTRRHGKKTTRSTHRHGTGKATAVINGKVIRMRPRRDNRPSATIYNPDGSEVTVRGNRDGSHTMKHRRGNKVRTSKHRHHGSWAVNNTTGQVSIGIAPGIHVTFGIF